MLRSFIAPLMRLVVASVVAAAIGGLMAGISVTTGDAWSHEVGQTAFLGGLGLAGASGLLLLLALGERVLSQENDQTSV